MSIQPLELIEIIRQSFNDFIEAYPSDILTLEIRHQYAIYWLNGSNFQDAIADNADIPISNGIGRICTGDDNISKAVFTVIGTENLRRCWNTDVHQLDTRCPCRDIRHTTIHRYIINTTCFGKPSHHFRLGWVADVDNYESVLTCGQVSILSFNNNTRCWLIQRCNNRGACRSAHVDYRKASGIRLCA